MKRSPNDPPEYPGVLSRTRELEKQYPHLSRSQAYVMAAVEIAPSRNSGAQFIGWDAHKRPIFRRFEYGKLRYNATTKGGDPTNPTPPFDLLPEVRQEGQM